MKTLLMICHYFQPDNAVGALRPMRFARHLPQFGWKAKILTTDKGVSDGFADSFDVTRVKPYDEKILNGLTLPVFPSSLREKVRDGLLWRTRRHFSFPDPHTSVNRWYLSLVKEAEKLIRAGEVDAVWSTSPPQTYVCIAGRIAKKAAVPVIVDMRDDWTENFTYEYKGLRDSMCRHLEAAAVARAAAVLQVTPVGAEKLRMRYPEYAGKIQCLQNGFDTDDIPSPISRNDGRFVLAMIGQSYEDHGELFGAIRIAREIDPDFAHRCVFRWVGYEGPEIDLPGVELHPRVSQRKSLEMVADADAFWLDVPFDDNTDLVIRSKTYEYLAMRRPILGTLPEKSCNADVARRVCNCSFIASRKPAEIAELMVDAFNHWKEGRLDVGVDETALADFEARSLTLKLSRILDDITNTGG